MPNVDPATVAVTRDSAFAGMRCVDTSDNPKIPLLMELVGALSRAVDPQEVLSVFSARSGELFGPRGYVSISTRGLAPGEYKITRLMNLDGTGTLPTADPWLQWNDLPVNTGGFFGQLIRAAYPELIHHLKVRDDPVVGDALAEYGSLMAIPLFDNGEPINWAIFLRTDPEGFSVDDLEQSILRANLVGTAVKSALIAKELREAHARIKAEVERIVDIQRALLPQSLPAIPGLTLAVSYETFEIAGGDYYDFRPLKMGPAGRPVDPNEPWGIMIADASGHGPAAAVVMAMLQSILHAFPRMPEGPAEVLEHANEHLYSKRIERSFVTAFFAIYDPPTRRFAYARAGHNPPLLKNPGAGGQVTRLEAVGGIPLGVMESTRYEETTIQLKTRQTVVLYTDGITEAMSPDGTMFGQAGIERALTACTGEPECVVQSITEPLKKHIGGLRPSDDQTIVAMMAEEQ